MNNNIICPSCGASNFKKEEFSSSDELTLGKQFNYKQINYVCKECGEEGDFTGESDQNYLSALRIQQKQFVSDILDQLKLNNITMAYFERVFELPQRTLTRWKTGDFSATSLALLRVVSTYPWITNVAEHNFNHHYAQCSVISQAGALLNNVIKKTGHENILFDITGDSNSISATAKFVFKDDSSDLGISSQNYLSTGA